MTISLKPINQQVIVITGASSGIGLATAMSAAKRGARVVLAARSEETLREVTRGILDDGGEATYVVADVGNRGEVENIATAAIRAYERIDTWVNGAGVSIYGRIDEVSEEDSRKLFDTNFWGVVNGSLVALAHFKNGGALINVGSEVSEATAPLLGMYSASKHAVKGFTDSLRLEIESVDKADIAITLIQPTATNTPFPQNAKNYMTREPKLPSPQIDPQQVADAILAAATSHTRDVKVGLGAHMNTMMAKLVPGLADTMSAKRVGDMHYDEPPRNPPGSLFSPSESGRVRGSGPTNGNATAR